MPILPGSVMHVTILDHVINVIDCSILFRYSSWELFISIPHSRVDGPRSHYFCCIYNLLFFRALTVVILHEEVGQKVE
jgi:hypothetical protein